MRWRRTIGDVAERVAQGGQLVDLPIDGVGLLMEHVARQLRQAIAAEHAGDLVQRESRRFPHRDQLELQQNFGRKLPSQAMP